MPKLLTEYWFDRLYPGLSLTGFSHSIDTIHVSGDFSKEASGWEKSEHFGLQRIAAQHFAELHCEHAVALASMQGLSGTLRVTPWAISKSKKPRELAVSIFSCGVCVGIGA